MNKIEKIVKSTVGKINILSIVCAAIVLVGVVVLAIFGFNREAVSDDVSTLTVKVNQYAYSEYADDIEDICNDVFDELDLSYEYDMKGEMSGDESEIVYVFDKDVDLKDAAAKLDKAFDTMRTEKGATVGVTYNSEYALDKLPQNALIRTIIAGAAFGVLACLYVTIRQKFTNGLTLLASMFVSAALTCSLILITRLPLTSSLVYVLFFNLLFTAAATTFTLSKVNAAQKENAELEAEEIITNNIATKQVLLFGSATAIALVLIGVIATSIVRNFALISLISLIAGVFSALFFAPAFYLPVKRYVDKKVAQRSRYDYKKGVKETKN